MSTHPNAILLVAFTPHSLSRKTMAAILAETNTEPDDDVKIGGIDYHHVVMESSYDDAMQVSSKEGDLLFLNFVTYGYGEGIAWADLQSQKESLEAWAKGICERHACDYQIRVSANYW